MTISRTTMFRVWLRPKPTDDWELSACGEFEMASQALGEGERLLAKPYLGGAKPYAVNVRRIVRVAEEVSLSMMFQAERETD